MAKELQTKPVAALTIKDLLLKQRDNVAMALPKHLDADRMLRVVTTSIQRNPALLKCDAKSLVGCVLEAAALGLTPDGVTGQAYLIPYGTQCTLIVGYKGLMTLARQSGEVSTIYAEVVREGDEFECTLGDSPSLRHVPNFKGQRGKVYAVYAVAILKDGGKAIRVMTVDEIEAIRGRSRAGRSGPWVTDWQAMARKTAVRQLIRWLPMATEDTRMHRAAEMDEAAEQGRQRLNADLETGAVDMVLDAETVDEQAPAAIEQQEGAQ